MLARMIGEANLRSALKMLPSVYSVSEPVYPVSEPVYSVSEPAYSASEPEGGDFSPVDLKPEPAFRSASLAGSDLSSVSESVLRPESDSCSEPLPCGVLLLLSLPLSLSSAGSASDSGFASGSPELLWSDSLFLEECPGADSF